MKHRNFVSSPPITPERLYADREDAFEFVPPWVCCCGFADVQVSLHEDAVRLYVGKQTLLGLTLSVLAAAVIFELTRYGNSVATNGNGGPDEDMHVRLTLAGHAEDNQTLQRLVMNAGLHKRVELGENRTDLRAENLTLVGDGKAVKDAREIAIKYALALAEKANADPQAYEANLRTLFNLHDELHLGTTEY